MKYFVALLAVVAGADGAAHGEDCTETKACDEDSDCCGIAYPAPTEEEIAALKELTETCDQDPESEECKKS